MKTTLRNLSISLSILSILALPVITCQGEEAAKPKGGKPVKLANIKQPPLNTTMMGVVKAVSDYYKLGLSEPMVYGLSGHAFLINIHEQLCTSGPYVWKREEMNPQFANMGLKVTDLGFFSQKNSKEERAEVEKKLRSALDKKIPCSLINMENQLIDGYDEKGFDTAQPWAPKVKFPPARLSFGSWKELGKEIHMNFYTFEKTKPVDQKAAIIASLDYAIDLHKNSEEHSNKAFGIGPRAYDNWIEAVPKHGASHGNWWNGTVWSECRQMASKYFAEIGKEHKKVVDTCDDLEKAYLKISENLKKISDKKLDAEKKKKLLEETKYLEADAIEKVEILADYLRDEQ